MLPHVVVETENLLLHSRAGSVTADIWLTGNNKSRRVSMILCCDDGNIQAKIVRLHCPEFLVKIRVNKNAQHDAFSSNKSGSRPSLDIKTWATYGGVYLSLPRCFRGLIAIKPSRDGIALSPALEERTALLTDVDAARVYFVGDRPSAWMSWRDDDNKEGDVWDKEEDDDEEGEDEDNEGEDDKEGEDDDVEGADDNKGGEKATVGVGGSPEEPLDKIIVTSWTSAVQIRWEGEPELPR